VERRSYLVDFYGEVEENKVTTVDDLSHEDDKQEDDHSIGSCGVREEKLIDASCT
jgi:hypothetical protein